MGGLILRKLIIVSLIVSAIVGAIWLYGWLPAAYTPSPYASSFPLPTEAQLVYEQGDVVGFECSETTFSNNLPISYQLALQRFEWIKLEDTAKGSTYKKGTTVIFLTTTEHYIEITNNVQITH